jgi:hypothetical protein
LNARLALLEVETSGKQYFKPSYGNHYILTFDRKKTVLVKGTPSEKLTRRVQDRYDKNITHEVPVTEWVGDTQTWSVTSKELHRLIMLRMQEGFSTVEFWKEKTGEKKTDVRYHVVGVR